MDEGGQAFSAFQLLISAVVAVAILGILMAILGMINPPTQNPTEAAKSLLQGLVNAPGTLQETAPVIFAQNTTISSEALVTAVNLDPSQACLDLGEYEDDERFKLLQGSGGEVIQWTGVSERKAKIAIVCAMSGPNLEDYVDNVYDDSLTEPDPPCDCYSEGGRCCLIQLKKA